MSLESLSASFRLDRSRSAASQVYEFLRELIVTLALEPGTTLSRTQVAECLDLSPMPVRDALSRLEKEGLVEIFPQHLTRVRGIDLDSARQMHVLRLSVELEIVHGLAKAPDPALVKSLLAALTKQRACLEAGDLGGFIMFDQEFHKKMYGAAQLLGVWDMIRSASGNLDRLRRLHVPVNGKAQSVLEEHAGITRAIGEGDAAAAQAWVRRHLSGTLAELDSLRERYRTSCCPCPISPIARLPDSGFGMLDAASTKPGKEDAMDADISAIRQLMRQELSLFWNFGIDANWEGFAGAFLPDAAMFPAARPARMQTLGQFLDRMKRLRDEGKLAAFKVTPLGCDVRVFGNVAVAFAACELLENESVVNREVNATVLVRDNGEWRIAAQAWDLETGEHPIPHDLGKSAD